MNIETQIWGRCIHFRGIMAETCGAGIRSDSLDDLPCLRRRGKAEPPCGPCDKRSWPTPEYIAQEIAEIEKEVVMFSQAVPLISDLKSRHPKGWSGTVVCPVCAARMHVAISAHNGHARVACSKEGCLKFTE